MRFDNNKHKTAMVYKTAFTKEKLQKYISENITLPKEAVMWYMATNNQNNYNFIIEHDFLKDIHSWTDEEQMLVSFDFKENEDKLLEDIKLFVKYGLRVYEGVFLEACEYGYSKIAKYLLELMPINDHTLKSVIHAAHRANLFWSQDMYKNGKLLDKTKFYEILESIFTNEPICEMLTDNKALSEALPEKIRETFLF